MSEHYSVSSTDILINRICREKVLQPPSLAAVQASFFLFAAFFSLGRDNSAWFYIRESITMLGKQPVSI
jgi:hypothetical protein